MMNKLIIIAYLLSFSSLSNAVYIDEKAIFTNSAITQETTPMVFSDEHKKDGVDFTNVYEDHSKNCEIHTWKSDNRYINNASHSHLSANKYKDYQIPLASRSILWTPYKH